MSLPTIYTIGYEGAAVEDLIATLKEAGVTRLVDIRESPYSKRSEFSKDEIRAALQGYGITYEHIQALGNPPSGREAARSGHKAVYREIFLSHLDSKDGRQGVEHALALAAREPICLLCYERSVSHCHREMVVDRMTALSGQTVVHLRISARQAHPAQEAFEF